MSKQCRAHSASESGCDACFYYDENKRLEAIATTLRGELAKEKSTVGIIADWLDEAVEQIAKGDNLYRQTAAERDALKDHRDELQRQLDDEARQHAVTNAERKAALAERDEWHGLAKVCEAQRTEARAERDTLARRMEELEDGVRNMHDNIVAGGQRISALLERIDTLTAENGRLTSIIEAARRMVKPQPGDGDWACDECRPNSEILQPGFKCWRHAPLRVDAALAGGGEKRDDCGCPDSTHQGCLRGCPACEGSPAKGGCALCGSDTQPKYHQEAADIAADLMGLPAADTKPVAGVEQPSVSQRLYDEAHRMDSLRRYEAAADLRGRALAAEVEERRAAPSEAAESERRTLFGLEALTGGEWLESQPPTRHLDEEGARTLAMKSTYLDGRERRIVRVDEVRTVLADTARITKEPK